MNRVIIVSVIFFTIVTEMSRAIYIQPLDIVLSGAIEYNPGLIQVAETSQLLPHILTVKSSAGTGKTYNLALRYLQLLALSPLTGTGPVTLASAIVAITFTNKAASEMRVRIIDWMKRIILDLPFEGTERRPIEEILKTEGAGGKTGAYDFEILGSTVQAKIASDFEGMLRNFYDFKVSTIDSFVNLTLKASAFRLELPPDFELSTESSTYIDLVLQECLQRILEEKAVRDKFDLFLQAYIETEGENASWIPKTFLRDTITLLWREEAKENRALIERRSTAGAEQLRKDIGKAALDLLSRLTAISGTKPHKNFVNALELLSGPAKLDLGESAYFRKPSIEKCLSTKSGPPDTRSAELWGEIRHLLGLYAEALSESKFAPYVGIYGLFKDMLKHEVTYRKKIVLIEQLNVLLQRIMDRKEFVPEVYYALAERYAHFLIDEFQDTSHLQWKNIEILADEALSRGGTLFLVGDKKQAIYRWRGGKSDLVDEVTRRYRSYPVHGVDLSMNYRSSGNIVTLNNALFRQDNLGVLLNMVMEEAPEDDRQRLIGTYEGSMQEPMEERKEGGYVYVEALMEGSGGEDIKEVSPKEERYEIVKTRFTELIRRIRKRKVFRDDEIAVLVRRREEAEFIVKTLLEMDIGVDSEFTVNIMNNPLINEAITFLKFLDASESDIAFAGFITGTIFGTKSGMSRAEIHSWLFKARTESRDHLYKTFRHHYPEVWEDLFEQLFRSAGYLPLYELFVLFLKKWAVLTSFSEDGPYFLHLCEIIKERERIGANNLSGFLRFWEENRSRMMGAADTNLIFSLKTVEGTEAVKVLTIHKAKGLQFPVVILPFLKLSTFGASDTRDKTKFFVPQGTGMKLLYIKKDFVNFSNYLGMRYREKEAEHLLDELNNMYVACTRAERKLYVFLTGSKRQKNYLIDYLFGLDDLQKYTDRNVIEIGTEEGYVRNEEGPEQEVKEIQENEVPAFADLGEELRWMERIRTKIEDPDAISGWRIAAERKGDVIHYILSLVKWLPTEYVKFLDNCIEAGLGQYDYRAHKAEIREIIFRFFDNPEFRRFFLPREGVEVFTEKEIVDIRGNNHKVDRIVMDEGHVDVIDFKTGESRLPENRDQIRTYGQLVSLIHPGKEVRNVLFYIDEGRVEML